jgi:hypothetical protein
MSDETSAPANTGSVEREVYRSASALALGLGLLLGGVAILLLLGPIGFMAPSAFSLMVILAIVTLIAGAIQLVVGVYQCADNIDRATRALLDGRRGETPAPE